MNKIKLKDISTLIVSGLTPSRANPNFWENGEIYWLKPISLEKDIFTKQMKK